MKDLSKQLNLILEQEHHLKLKETILPLLEIGMIKKQLTPEEAVEKIYQDYQRGDPQTKSYLQIV